MPADVPFTDLVEVNPRRGLKRGERYPFIEMAAVPEGGGRPTHHEEREFDGGGSKFAVGDTLFARITPCTENGKLAYVDALPIGSIGFGSTELIVLSARPGKADPRFVYQVAASGRIRRRPGRSEQELIAGLIEAVRWAAVTEHHRLAGMRILKAGLANALLSGDVRIQAATYA